MSRYGYDENCEHNGVECDDPYCPCMCPDCPAEDCDDDDYLEDDER
jgi:hypothetical protein